MSKYLDDNGLLYFWGKLKTLLAGKVNTETGKGLSENDFTDALKTKLEGIATGAQVNSVTGVKGGSETDYRTGNVSITATNIGLGNVTNNKQVKGLSSGTTAGNIVTWGSDGYTVADGGVTVAVSVPANAVFTDTTYSEATTTTAGLMSAADKTALNSITSGYVTGVKGDSESTYRTGNINITKANIGLSNVTNDKQVKGKSSGTTSGHVVTWGSDGYTVADSGFTIGKSVPSDAVFTDTTYSAATTTAAGLMSAQDKTTLNTLNSSHVSGVKGSSESTYRTGNVNITSANIGLGNVTNNKQVKGLSTGTTSGHIVTWGTDGYTVADGGYTVGTNVPSDAVFTDTTYSAATTSAAGLMSAQDKVKLNGIATGATKVTVDSSLSSSSTNPVRNSAIYTALQAKLDTTTAQSTYAKKTDISGVYKYKGSVATYSALPSTGQVAGDVYNVQTHGKNYAWDGTDWDDIGGVFDINTISNAEIDTIMAS